MSSTGKARDADAAIHAAEKIYGSPDRAKAMADAHTAGGIVGDVQQGRLSAPAILLLGYAPGSADVLRQAIAAHGSERVKLHSWKKPVTVETAATVALSRAGDASARRRLLEKAPEYDTATRVFLLDTLSDIDAPEVWHVLTGYLKDETAIADDVPSGADQRRVADHAVDSFVNLLKLPVSFEIRPGGRYSPAEIEETARHIREKVPR